MERTASPVTLPALWAIAWSLAARQNRDRNLADFGRGEDELHMFRRLFERLQQAVEGLRREHVHLVDDVDLVARRNGRVAHLVDDLTDVVDAGMRRGVHFEHVDMAAFEDRLAVLAELGQFDGGLVDCRGPVVEGAGEDARSSRLADAAHAGEHPGLRDSAGGERVGQRAHHRLLADQRGEITWAIFARQHAVACAADCLAHPVTELPFRAQGDSLSPRLSSFAAARARRQ